VVQLRVTRPRPFGLALFHEAVEAAPCRADDPTGQALLTLLVATVLGGPEAPVRLQLPTDPHCRAMAELLVRQPALGLNDAARRWGHSRRSAARRFRWDLDTTPARWQRRSRALLGLELLEQGATVAEAATAVGYRTPSAFSHAFRIELGQPPRAHRRS
jgi:AraC-like DNA-binding protein